MKLDKDSIYGYRSARSNIRIIITASYRFFTTLRRSCCSNPQEVMESLEKTYRKIVLRSLLHKQRMQIGGEQGRDIYSVQ